MCSDRLDFHIHACACVRACVRACVCAHQPLLRIRGKGLMSPKEAMVRSVSPQDLAA